MQSEAAAPAVVDKTEYLALIEALRAREKAHMREGDKISDARRCVPMVDIARRIRRTSNAYRLLLHVEGLSAAEQCEGCTYFTTQVRELSHIHSRDVSYANFCQGPLAESPRYRDFMGWTMPWYSA